jgi:hypothetical protein
MLAAPASAAAQASRSWPSALVSGQPHEAGPQATRACWSTRAWCSACATGVSASTAKDSACLGNAAGPNPARREPSTCARCRNFVVSPQHRTYWLEQARRCESLLNQPALPRQTLRIVRERLNEAHALASDARRGKRRGEQPCVR